MAEETVWAGDAHEQAHGDLGRRGTLDNGQERAGDAQARAGAESAAKQKANPLQDLIRTENLYVEDLGVIIKRVAAAWSRSNFPPKVLDTMFRAVEAVYRINKSLLAKLNEIGPNPASPKALGDLLMRWITDLEPAYARYANTYQTSFDFFEPVQANPRLLPILHSLPWPATLLPPNPQRDGSETYVSLDVLFLLPTERLAYYKRLYARLLKSTQEGRSDHALLVAANERLDHLLELCEEAKTRTVVPVVEAVATPNASNGNSARPESNGVRATGERSSGESTPLDSPGNSDRFSSARTASSTSTAQLSGPPRVEDLERRLSTERALDIFTMLPKKCKLQMAPANLPFTRQLRRSSDVVLSFFPLSDPEHREIVIRRAYVFLLTDLFLVCERMTPEERSENAGPGGEGPDMWLLYPPLAGKHLRVVESARDSDVDVVVMRKERLTLRTESREAAEAWRSAFEDAIDFGSSQPPPVRTATTSSSSRSQDSPTSNGSFRAGNLSPISTNLATSNSSSQGGYSPLALSPDFRQNAFGPSPDREPTSSRSPSGRSPMEQPLPLPPPPRDWQRGLPERPLPSTYVPRPPRKQSMGAPLDGHSLPPLPPSPLPLHLSSSLNGRGPVRQGTSEFYGAHIQEPPQQPPPPPQYPPPENYGLPRPGYTQSSSYGSLNSSLGHQPYGFEQQQQNFPPPRSTPSPHQQPYHHQQPPNPRFAPPQPQYTLQKSNSSRSHGSYTSTGTDRSSGYPDAPPMPGREPGIASSRRTDPGSVASGLLSPGGSMHRSCSADALTDGHYRMPSQALLMDERSNSAPGSAHGAPDDDSPPPSPVGSKAPTATVIAAQMRCKAFLQQNHAQWKSLGTAKLKLFVTEPANTKQLVVESDKSDKKIFVSTIVLTDGVERVGKTGVAIELSDSGNRTGIVYMLQMKTEAAATSLFDLLLKGSDRANRLSAPTRR